MLRKGIVHLYQVGAHVPHGNAFRGARMRHWPRQQLPQNLTFLPEQRWSMKPMPRDTGRVPRDFVLGIIYKSQPVNVADLWDLCASDTSCVLDSKRHLRAVLKQSREEGFLSFEKDPATDAWTCTLTRERFEEVRQQVVGQAANQTPAQAGLRGRAAEKTAELSTAFESMDREAKLDHLAKLREALKETTSRVERFQRTEVDYLPYTTLNGKVDFMWWYETKDVSTSRDEALDGPAAALPVGGDQRLPVS